MVDNGTLDVEELAGRVGVLLADDPRVARVRSLRTG